MFIGRKEELNVLNNLKQKKSASLVTITGRRRIGKSRLAEEFGKNYKFYSFIGMPPNKDTTAEGERKGFALQLEKYFNVPIRYDNWYILLSFLAKQTIAEDAVILFDEISWMGSRDQQFLGTLKSIWDQEFSKNDKLVMILCGSISLWIEKNILSSTGFVGRISLKLDLKELSLKEAAEFWPVNHTSAHNVLKILSITGGVPRYLEEIYPNENAEANIKRLCFDASGILFNEFEQIFSDLFDNKYTIYRDIVLSLVDGAKTREEISDLTKLPANGVLSDYLENLEKTNFISRYYTWNLKTEKSMRLSQYRLSDNYLRFYLKYIMPNKDQIKKGHFKNIDIYALPKWFSMMGMQFENLVIHNRNLIHNILDISPTIIINDGPYFQQKTKRHSGCQVDYMIQTKSNELYVIEIKCLRQAVEKSIIQEMKDKIKALDKPKYYAIRPVLIHINGVGDSVEEENYFYKLIDFSKLITL